MARASARLTRAPGYQTGSFVLFGSIGALLIAFAFELAGFAPCPLCLQQRYAYYAAIPLTFLALVVMSGGARYVASGLFLFVGFAFIANAILGGYHAGVEWGYWPGPDSCGGSLQPLSIGSLQASLENNSVVSCSEAAFRFLGLSFAGWNVLASAFLAACGLFAAQANYNEARVQI